MRLAVRALLCAGLAVWWVAAPAAAHQAGAPARATDPAVATAPWLPIIRPAPDFALLDPAGRRVRLSELRGRVVLVAFVYTRCTAACPLLTARMARLERLLGPDAGRVRLLSITVDPARDSADALAEYARRFGADGRRWHFLREEPAALAPVLASYDEWARPVAAGEIEHPARLHLVDAAGRVREIYSLGFFDERQALIDIRALLREGYSER
ncbi:MAG: SCO family protein [Candidatus Rokubacteria bacterium]|nr:SCO family protein [Candidatus Rokubacteria bacterium]